MAACCAKILEVSWFPTHPVSAITLLARLPSYGGPFLSSNANSAIEHIETGQGCSNDFFGPELQAFRAGNNITGMQDDTNGDFIVQNAAYGTPGFDAYTESGPYLMFWKEAPYQREQYRLRLWAPAVSD